MTAVVERRRDVGGYDAYHERSRSRGHILEPRGEKYGREPIRGDKPLAGPDQDMQRSGGGGGGYRDRPFEGGRGGSRGYQGGGGGGSYRDRQGYGGDSGGNF